MWMYVVCFCQCTRRCYWEVWGYLRLLETKDEVVGDSEDVENPASGRCAVKKKARGSGIPSCSREKEIRTYILELDAKSLQIVQSFTCFKIDTVLYYHLQFPVTELTQAPTRCRMLCI